MMGPLLCLNHRIPWGVLLVLCLLRAGWQLPQVCAQPSDPGATLVSGLQGLLSSPVYSAVVQAVVAANLTGPIATLADTTGITIFAPSNAAFQALGNETISCLVNQPQLPLLTSILQYHVLKGVYNSTTLAKAAPESLISVNGKALNFTIQGASVLVDEVNITAPDAIQLPGSAVVHGLPSVLVPPGGLAAVQALCVTPTNVTGGNPSPTNLSPPGAITSGACSHVSYGRRSLPSLFLGLCIIQQLSQGLTFR